MNLYTFLGYGIFGLSLTIGLATFILWVATHLLIGALRGEYYK